MSSQAGAASTFTPNTIKPAGYLCYLNGKRVPIVSASVSYGVGEIPSATITLFPSKHLHRLGYNDSLEVQLFYLDVHYDTKNPQYRMLFDGTVTSWNYSSSAHGRSLSFTATMDIAKYHQARMELLSSNEAVTSNLATQGMTPNTVPVAGIFHSYALFYKGLQYPTALAGPVQTPAPTITRPFEFLWNTAMSLCSNSVPINVISVPVVNFFARWARKRNFVNRLVGFPYYDDLSAAAPNGVFPLLKAVQSQQLLGVIAAAQSAAIGSGGSMMDILNMTLGNTYCELAMIPTAPLVRVRLDGTIIGNSSSPGNPVEKAELPLRLANYFVKPQAFFGMAPRFNVLFPSQIKQLSYVEHYSTQPTRIYAYDDYAGTLTNAQNAPTARSLLTVAYPPAAEAAMNARAQMNFTTPSPGVSTAISTGKNILLWKDEFFRGPVPEHVRMPYVYGQLQVILDKLSGANPLNNADSRTRLQSLGRLYAEETFYMKKYEQRGGQADLTFNPYVLPGFPCIIYDHRGSGYDQVGYLLNVVHTLSKGELSTAINYSHGRTLREHMEELINVCATGKRKFGGAPLQTIDAVRQGFQNPDKAQEIYQRMFYNGSTDKAVADPLEYLKYENGTLPEVTGPTETNYPISNLASQVALQPSLPLFADTSKILPDQPLVPRDEYIPYFYGTDNAMTHTSRPICTLEEYVRFVHGDAASPAGVSAPRTVNGVVVYDQIFTRPWAQHDPTADELGGYVTTAVAGVLRPTITIPPGDPRHTTLPTAATAEAWYGAIDKYIEEIENSNLLIE